MGTTASKYLKHISTQASEESKVSKPSKAIYGRYFHPCKKRCKIAFQRNQIDGDLLNYLQVLPIFNHEEIDLPTNGFSFVVDYPQLPNHRYFEGYFHAKGDVGAKFILSQNPRTWFQMHKPSAPIEIRAYVEALRRCNATKFVALLSKLDAFEAPECFRIMTKLIEQGNVFGDLAIQIHFGDEVVDDNLGWHCDTFNSLIHVATSIRGRRALHTRVTDDIEITGGLSDSIYWQEPGSVYLTSPTFMEHTPEYPACPAYADRIIAIQARLLLTSEDDQSLSSFFQADAVELQQLSELIADALEESQLIMPSLAQVLELVEEMRESASKMKDFSKDDSSVQSTISH